MAGRSQFKNGTWQFVVKRAGLLPKPLYGTFATEAEGEVWAARVEALLDRGIVPSEAEVAVRVLTVRELVREYESNAHPSRKDQSALNVTVNRRGDAPLTDLNASWVDAWIAEMKRVETLAPATIRARVGALARCTDWGMRKGYLTMPDHAFRSLPEGYASYTKADVVKAGVKRVDTERDRRLEDGEYERILDVIAAGVLPRKQRALKLPHPHALRCLFVLAVETAMRLRETFTLTLGQVDLKKKTVFLDKTKNGDKRQVPLSSVAMAAVKDYMKVRAGCTSDLLFPFWDGDESPEALNEVTDELSKLFSNTRAGGIFEAAGCDGLRYHDLRHEATSRLFERTKLSDLQIAKITGHKSMRMLARYANLRGSDLAAQLW